MRRVCLGFALILTVASLLAVGDRSPLFVFAQAKDKAAWELVKIGQKESEVIYLLGVPDNVEVEMSFGEFLELGSKSGLPDCHTLKYLPVPRQDQAALNGPFGKASVVEVHVCENLVEFVQWEYNNRGVTEAEARQVFGRDFQFKVAGVILIGAKNLAQGRVSVLVPSVALKSTTVFLGKSAASKR